MKYIIKWINTKTGQKGQGKPIDEKTARLAAIIANSEYPYMNHYVEPVNN